MNKSARDEEAVSHLVPLICARESRAAMAEAAEEIYIGTKTQPHSLGSAGFQALMNAGLRAYLSEPKEAVLSDSRAQPHLHHLLTIRAALKRIGEIPA